MDATTTPPAPTNESTLDYAPDSPERHALLAELAQIQRSAVELPAYIGGQWRQGSGEEIAVVQPHDHQHVLGITHNSTHADAEAAIEAAHGASAGWRTMPFDDRAAILLRAADLLAGPWRQRLNSATMLGQSKTAFQAEIDAACELIDFWRFNVHFAAQIMRDQPIANSKGVWNRTDHRPLKGFVYAITPFNFTAIAGNLPTAPALMGNTVVWNPLPSQQLAASLTMAMLEDAGLPPGVINMLPGDGLAVSETALAHPDLAGIHFTGSTPTFQHLWRNVGENIDQYRSYPRLVGETGGKDFVLAHPSADPAVLRTALIRGAFEYQGQKWLRGVTRSCSSIAVAADSRRPSERNGSAHGGRCPRPGNFMGAVIDARAFRTHQSVITRAKETKGLTVLAGGTVDDSVGWFVSPTIVECEDPADDMFRTEFFGPILAVHVYDDGADDSGFQAVARCLESSTPYALTGAVIARDRRMISWAARELRFAAGNFYINDKPTGAVVGQQPFGGGRASGTNDKAGSSLNLLRWTSPRSIKETFDAAVDSRYPHMVDA